MIYKVILLHGSPRAKSGRSNSSRLAYHYLNNIETEKTLNEWFLPQLSYRGCTACGCCQQGFDGCVLTDDLSDLLQAVMKSDLLLIASPIYFDHISSSVQAFLERCQSFYKPHFLSRPDKSRLASGKKVVVATSQEQAFNHRYNELKGRLTFAFKTLGFSEIDFIAEQVKEGSSFNSLL